MNKWPELAELLTVKLTQRQTHNPIIEASNIDIFDDCIIKVIMKNESVNSDDPQETISKNNEKKVLNRITD